MKRLGNGVGSVYKLAGTRSKPWVARKTVGWKENGQPKYKFIGYYRTRTEAMNALVTYNKAPYSLDGETLKQMYEGFIAGYEEKHTEKTTNNIKSTWKHLEPLYDVALADLTRKHLQLFFDTIEVTEHVKQTIKTLLKQIMDYSIRYDVIQPEKVVILDYIDLSSHVPTRTVSREVFSDEEIDRLWNMDDDMSRTILFMIYTGLRAGEYCGMEFDEGVVHIRNSKTKAGIRDIPLSDKALKLIHTPIYADYYEMKYHFTAWRKKNGFDHTLHDTRHTCVSRLTNAGVDERIIQAIVGHKGKNVTEKVYTHIDLEVMRDALNKI